MHVLLSHQFVCSMHRLILLMYYFNGIDFNLLDAFWLYFLFQILLCQMKRVKRKEKGRKKREREVLDVFSGKTSTVFRKGAITFLPIDFAKWWQIFKILLPAVIIVPTICRAQVISHPFSMTVNECTLHTALKQINLLASNQHACM